MTWGQITLITLGVLNLAMGLVNFILNRLALREDKKQNKALRIDNE